MTSLFLRTYSVALALAQNPPPAAEPPPALVKFLQETVAFTADQMAAVTRGEPVVKVLETRERRDIAVFGITTLNVSREAYVERVRDTRRWLSSGTRSQFGIFSDPPAPEDVQAATLSKRDVDEMKNCKPGDCVIKLPATDMRRIKEETDWSARDLQERLSAYGRQRLVEYVTDYRRRGDAAMAVYDDRGNVRASEAFAGLLGDSPFVYQTVPSLREYLTAYPNATLAGATEVLYWSEDIMPRLRPIFSVTHQVVYTPPELPGMTLIAAKQIYANHYFEAMVDLTSVVEPSGPGAGSASYLVMFRRFRFDNLPSGGLINIRGRATGALRDQLLADLKREMSPATRAPQN